jgi:hypothetical protein
MPGLASVSLEAKRDQTRGASLEAADNCANLTRAHQARRADEYEAYNYDVGIRPLIKLALGVQTFREDLENETEFMTISYWESIASMSEFTSSDPFEVHHLERDEEFLIELPKKVQILRLLKSHAVTYSGDEESD